MLSLIDWIKTEVSSLPMRYSLIESTAYNTHVQKREARLTANVLITMIDRMKGDASSLPGRYSQFEASAYNTQGRIAIDEGTEESARRAVVHFEKLLQVFEEFSDADGIASAKRNIAMTMSMFIGVANNEELLKTSRELFKIQVTQFGEEKEQTICEGKSDAAQLLTVNRGGGEEGIF
jgi:hypothetical protein